MDKERIINSIGQEIDRAIKAKFNFSGGRITINEIIEEGAVCLVANHLILSKKLPQGLFSDAVMAPFIEGVFKQLRSLFPNNFEQNHQNLIFDQYKKILRYHNPQIYVDAHYEGLFS